MKPLVPVVLACVGLLAGCGSIDRTAPPTAGNPTSPATAPDNAAVVSKDPFQARAAAVAKTWLDSGLSKAWTTGFVPLQELVVVPDWTPNGDLKASYGNGWIRSSVPLPDTPGKGEIRFPDGASLAVPVLGAKTAYRRLPERSGECPMAGQPPTCQWLTITAAKLSTMKLLTSRGLATVPAWVFTVEGLSQPLLRAAVGTPAMTSLPEPRAPEQDAPKGVVSAMHLASIRGDVVAFDIGIGACDKNPRGLVREFAHLIVIGGSVTVPFAGTSCNSSLEIRRVAVRTKQPVGTRPVVDALSGRPVLPQLARQGP